MKEQILSLAKQGFQIQQICSLLKVQHKFVLSILSKYSEFEINFNREFGVEIELASCNLSMSQMVDAFNNAGINAIELNYLGYQEGYWMIKPDGSVSAYEVVSPHLFGKKGIEELKQVLLILNNNGANVNNKCGLHIHFFGLFTDENDSLFGKIIRVYQSLEGEIDLILPSSRRENSNNYCRSLVGMDFSTSNNFTECNNIYNGGRYFKVNIQSYLKCKSIEFRQHSGTTNFEKISNWIYILNQIIDLSIKQRKATDLISFVGASQKEYIKKRKNELNKNI